VPEELKQAALGFLDEELTEITAAFAEKYMK